MNPTARMWPAALVVLLAGAPEAKAQDCRIHVVVTVDWEGMSLKTKNLQAMEGFRRNHPDVPLTHFLNAAYYTKPNVQSGEVTQMIKQVLRPMDEVGLHIHGWKSLFESAGVKYKQTPTFWGGVAKASGHDQGHEVPISAYTPAELRKVIAYSCNTLVGAGFARPSSFRAGGWYATPSVMSALRQEGFKVDHSAVPYAFLDEVQGTPLFKDARKLWSDTTSLSQPYAFSTRYGRMTQVPDNGALADYMTSEEMLQVFRDNVNEFKKNPARSRVVSIGFHQESADEYLSRVDSAIQAIRAEAQSKGVRINFVTGMNALKALNL